MINRIKEYLMYAGLSEEQFHQVKDEIKASNYKRILFFGIVAFIVFLGLSLLAICSDILVNIKGYTTGLLLSLLLLVSTFLLVRKKVMMTEVIIICYMSMMFLLGLYIGPLSTDMTSTVFIALIIVVPMFFVIRPIYNVLVISIFSIIFIKVVVELKTGPMLTYDVIHMIVFSIASIVLSTYLTIIETNRILLEHQLTELAQIDQLTYVRNRNSYKMRIRKMEQEDIDHLHCIYIDVNGLHELNNTQGHLAGDTMLQFVATCIKDEFGFDDTYRMGGDEFVAFGQNLSRSEIDKRIERMNHEVTNKGYHIAIGIGYQKQPYNFRELLREAEENMYENKKEYYKNLKTDRKSRI